MCIYKQVTDFSLDFQQLYWVILIPIHRSYKEHHRADKTYNSHQQNALFYMYHPLHLIDAQLFNHKGLHTHAYATCQTNGSISHCCILCCRHFQSQMCESILLLALLLIWYLLIFLSRKEIIKIQV